LIVYKIVIIKRDFHDFGLFAKTTVTWGVLQFREAVGRIRAASDQRVQGRTFCFRAHYPTHGGGLLGRA